MNVTIEQARALDALERTGTLQGAARELHKAHTAVLYALKQLEVQTDLVLLDRAGYRLRFTAAGLQVLAHCRRLLEVERELQVACSQMRTGWEPSVQVVADGIVPIAPLLRWADGLVKSSAPTRVGIFSEFLGGVEQAFEAIRADYMVSVLPTTSAGLTAIRLEALRAVLVARRGHPLVTSRCVGRAELEAHVLLTVRGSDPRLALPTAHVTPRSVIHLSDFAGKREALLLGIGFGWMPEHMIAAELRARSLRRVRFDGGSEHVFTPRLYRRVGAKPGLAGQRLLTEWSPARA